MPKPENVPNAGDPAKPDPIKRAIILVPGFSKRERMAARNQLVDAFAHYSEGYKITAAKHLMIAR